MADQISEVNGWAELAYALGEDVVVKVGGRRRASRRLGARRSTGGPLGHDGGMELFQMLGALAERLGRVDLGAAIYVARACNVMAERVGEPGRSFTELTGGGAARVPGGGQ